MSTESSNGDEELDLPPTCGLMILKIIIVNILLSLGDQISDFLQVSFSQISGQMVSISDNFLDRFRMIDCCCCFRHSISFSSPGYLTARHNPGTTTGTKSKASISCKKTKIQKDKETKKQRDKKTKRQRDKGTKRQKDNKEKR